jgi:beta-lactamase class D
VRVFVIFILIGLASCQNNSQIEQQSTSNSKKEKEELPKAAEFKVLFPFQQILTEAKVEGSLNVYDLEEGIYYSNDIYMLNWETVPASTFKIVNSIIGLEMGLIDSTTIFKWDGKKRGMKQWEADLSLKQAFQKSCVPCYQKLARQIGVDSMRHYLQKLDYGKMKVDANSIDQFWLEGDSKISAKAQINFIKRLYQKELPIKASTSSYLKEMMLIDSTAAYKLYGKTGWAIRKDENIGWFIGYIKSEKGSYILASHIQPKKEFEMNNFPKIRLALCLKALEALDLIKQ